MYFENVNTEALRKAITLALGPDGAQVIEKLYLTINAIQLEEYDRGHKAGFIAGEQSAKDASFDEGFEEGVEQGYIDGVLDAQDDLGLALSIVDSMNLRAAEENLYDVVFDGWDELDEAFETARDNRDHAEGWQQPYSDKRDHAEGCDNDAQFDVNRSILDHAKNQ